jgi:VWFA-related protein
MRPVAVAAVGCTIWLTAFVGAQQSPQPTFRAGVELVQFDVTVIDRNHRPVEGLTVADFTVRDDGEVRPIVTFTPVSLAGPAPAPAKWMTSFAPDVVTNARTEGRLVVILLDRNIAHGRPAQTAREVGAAIVDQLGRGDLAAVVHTARLNQSQSFTADRQRLLAAIQSRGVGMSLAVGTGRAIGDCPCGVCSIDFIAHIARTLGSAGPRQKTIFFIGSGIATAFDTDGEEKPTAAGACMFDRWTATRAMLAAAQQANVVVHTIDPQGLEALPRAAGAVGAGQGGQRVIQDLDSLRELASATGGRAVLNTNGPTDRIGPLFGEAQSYYLLAFDASRSLANGRLRRVEVTVNRPGVEVRTRRGYYHPRSVPAVTTDRNAAGGRVAPDIAGLLPNSALPLAMALVPVAEAGRDDTAVGIVLGVQRGDRSSDGGRIALGAKAFDTNGREQGSVRQVFDAAAIPSSFDVLARMYLRPGQYEIRATVDTPGGASVGSVYGYIDVPDFRRQRISLSGVALGRRGRPALPSDGLADVLPIVPTAERVFAPSDRVRGFVRMYQQTKGRPVAATLAVAVLDSSDRIVAEQTVAFDAGPFERDRATDCPFDLPLANLPPGNYLLRVDATASTATATRGVRFALR